MNRDEIIKLLQAEKAAIQREFNVEEIFLFGSAVRDEQDVHDVDLLVKFQGPAESKQYFGLQFYLEDRLGLPVDLVTEKALRPELKPSIEKEAIRI